MFKKIISLALTILFVLTLYTLVLAHEAVSMSGEMTVEEQIQVILNDNHLSAEEREFLLNRIALFEFSGDLRYDTHLLPESIRSYIENDVLASPRARSAGMTLPVRHIPQLTDWWCGPATVVQTLSYWNLSGANALANNARTTQHGAAYRLGMINTNQRNTPEANLTNGPIPDLAMLSAFVNGHSTGRHFYVATRLNARNTINNNIISALRTGIPPMIRMESANTNVWPYTTNGHFLNITGMQTDSSGVNIQSVMFTDPWVGSRFFNPGANGTFWRSLNDTYVVLTNDRQNMRRHNFAW